MAAAPKQPISHHAGSGCGPLDADQVLAFWFQECSPSQWFVKNQTFDQLLRERFIGLTRQAIASELAAWGDEPGHGLALVLLLDQFPRQIWRDSAIAFSGNDQALCLSQKALAEGWVAAEAEQARRQFWLMPQMHAEDLAIQEAAIHLFQQFTDERTARFASRHRDVIVHFGRFPHRNAALGRSSSNEQLAFLRTPGSGF